MPDDVDRVRLRMIHFAKGLELPAVVPEIGRKFVSGASADDDGYPDRVGVNDTGNPNGDSQDPNGDLRNRHGDTADAHGDSQDGNDETVLLLGIKTPSPDDAYDHVNTLARRDLRDQDR